MTAWNLRTQLADGMKVLVVAKPRLGHYGFSLNVEVVKPVGEGSIKKAFELLRSKLDKEGLFAPERKRPLPDLPAQIGVISSTQAAGYKDFIKILGERFGGMEITVADTAVQGDGAADGVIQAIKYFNESQQPPEVIAILRGGGSRDDLVAFDDELLVRAIAASRVPIIVGVGHEIDETLADLAADVRASTPSNAAEILVPDKREIIAGLSAELRHVRTLAANSFNNALRQIDEDTERVVGKIESLLDAAEQQYSHLLSTLRQLNPKTVLKRGYAIVRNEQGNVLKDKPNPGEKLQIEIAQAKIFAIVEKATSGAAEITQW